MDRHLARQALQPAGRRRPSGECLDGDDLHGELLPQREHHHPGNRGIPITAVLAQHARRVALGDWQHHAHVGDTQLRMGRGSEQRFEACRPREVVGNHRERRQQAAGQRIYLRDRQRDPQPDALSACERRARLRRRHPAVVVGTRQHARSWLRRRRHGRASGDGQPVFRHGGATGLTAGGSRAWHTRRHCTHIDDYGAGVGRHADRGGRRHRDGHRERRWWPGVESRSVDKRRRDLGQRVRHHVVDLCVDAVDRADSHAQKPRDRHRWQS